MGQKHFRYSPVISDRFGVFFHYSLSLCDVIYVDKARAARETNPSSNAGVICANTCMFCRDQHCVIECN